MPSPPASWGPRNWRGRFSTGSQATLGLNAFTSLDPEAVLAAARAADRRRRSDGVCGLLHGVPLSFKDNINVQGHATTAGTEALRSYRPDRDAAVTARLRQSGAIVLGKVGMHELAYGATSENPTYGTPRNPFAPDRTAGGSSGGSGAAVGAGLGPVSIGTDTGGSVRVPAAFCGVWGFRPSVGRWPTEGIVPISSSRDTPGPLARSARDLALVDRCVTGTATARRALKGLRIGICRAVLLAGCRPRGCNAVPSDAAARRRRRRRTGARRCLGHDRAASGQRNGDSALRGADRAGGVSCRAGARSRLRPGRGSGRQSRRAGRFSTASAIRRAGSATRSTAKPRRCIARRSSLPGRASSRETGST